MIALVCKGIEEFRCRVAVAQTITLGHLDRGTKGAQD